MIAAPQPPAPAPTSWEPERAARVVLARVAEPGDPVLHVLLRHDGAVATLDALATGHLRHPWAGRYRARLETVDRDDVLAEALAPGAAILCPGDPGWPAQLDELAELTTTDIGPAPPIALWVRGQTDLLNRRRSVGIVGSRAATSYGTGVATDLAYDLAGERWVIVSGAAYGIDAAAHRAALAAHGATVAVLACGVDLAYPTAHTSLLDAIVAAGGAVISEVSPGTPPSRARFLTRNRLIAGLAAGVVVVEAAVRSGALNTATWAAQLSRAVMAVPGPVTSDQSAGTHLAIARRGAALVTCGRDVSELLSVAGDGMLPEPREPASPRDGLSPDAAAVLDAIPTRGSVDVGTVAVAAGLDVGVTLGVLGELASDAWVVRTEAGWALAPRGTSPSG